VIGEGLLPRPVRLPRQFRAGRADQGHCYDYALPNGVVPLCVSTAWLKPSLDFAGYGFNDGLAIVIDMIDRFRDMLAGLTTRRPE
jgi:hypothetical protein